MRRWSLDASVAAVKRAVQKLSEASWRAATKPPQPFAAPVPTGRAPPPPSPGPAPDHDPPPGPVLLPDMAGLTLSVHVPPGLAPGGPLVVLLHGCHQDPEIFAAESGWLARARQDRFVLLLPGQSSERNAQRCFNWFREADISYRGGEAAAIAAMTRHTLARYRCDPTRVFVVGLSAGGAMAACLLAAFPRLYRAGAVVAGLPAGAASGMVGAMTRMAGRASTLSAASWAARARALAPSGETGPWPSLLIWHGMGDPVVDPANAVALAAQFADLLEMGDPSASVSGPITKRQWIHRDRSVKLTLIQQQGAGHAYQNPAATGADAFVIKGNYDITSEICSFLDIKCHLNTN